MPIRCGLVIYRYVPDAVSNELLDNVRMSTVMDCGCEENSLVDDDYCIQDEAGNRWFIRPEMAIVDAVKRKTSDPMKLNAISLCSGIEQGETCEICFVNGRASIGAS